jgi:hypothetical protein
VDKELKRKSTKIDLHAFSFVTRARDQFFHYYVPLAPLDECLHIINRRERGTWRRVRRWAVSRREQTEVPVGLLTITSLGSSNADFRIWRYTAMTAGFVLSQLNNMPLASTTSFIHALVCAERAGHVP